MFHRKPTNISYSKIYFQTRHIEKSIVKILCGIPVHSILGLRAETKWWQS